MAVAQQGERKHGRVPIEEPLQCPVCAALPEPGAPRCGVCGVLVAILADHPALDSGLVDRPLVERRIAEWQVRSENEPSEPAVHLRLGLAWFALGSLDEAAQALTAAAALAPEHVRLQTQLAVVLRDLAAGGRRGTEREAWERAALALHLEPNDSEALLLQATLHLARGGWREGMESLQQAVAVGQPEIGHRASRLLLAAADVLTDREQWLDAAELWDAAVAADAETARAPLLALLRHHQAVVLAPPRWSWLVYTPRWSFERGVRYAAAMSVAALAALVTFLLLARDDATLLLSLVFGLLVIVAPLAMYLDGRRRLRAESAPEAARMRLIRADPARLFRGEADMALVLGATRYLAVEMQGAAIAANHPWVAGRTSPGTRRAWRAASIRAPWLPDGRPDER